MGRPSRCWETIVWVCNFVPFYSCPNFRKFTCFTTIFYFLFLILFSISKQKNGINDWPMWKPYCTDLYLLYTSVNCEKKWRNFCVSNITILVRKGRGWSRHNLIQLYRVFSFSFSSLCFVFAFLFLPWMQLSPTVLTITKQDAPAIACSQALPV